jgi:hypothetical protein
MAYFTAYVQTNADGSRLETSFEVDDDDLDCGLNEDRTAIIDAHAQDAIANLYDWGWTEES